jgi:hypothetical protein
MLEAWSRRISRPVLLSAQIASVRINCYYLIYIYALALPDRRDSVQPTMTMLWPSTQISDNLQQIYLDVHGSSILDLFFDG